MTRGINSIIAKTDGYKVEWWQDWHNIAFSFAKQKAEGVDISDESVQKIPLLKMFDTAAYDKF